MRISEEVLDAVVQFDHPVVRLFAVFRFIKVDLKAARANSHSEPGFVVQCGGDIHFALLKRELAIKALSRGSKESLIREQN